MKLKSKLSDRLTLKSLMIATVSSAILLISHVGFAQAKIGDNATTIKPTAVLELESTNKALYPPRVALTAANVAAPVTGLTAADKGATVYNTANAGSGLTRVSEGLCTWDGAMWLCVNNVEQTSLTAFSASKGNSQAIAANTLTKMTYVTEDYDRGNDYNTGTSQFVVQSAGIYQITACASFPSGNLASTTGRSIRLHKNGVQINGGLVASNMVGNEAFAGCGATNVLCAVGDVLELYAHVGGTGLTITTASFEALKVSK